MWSWCTDDEILAAVRSCLADDKLGETAINGWPTTTHIQAVLSERGPSRSTSQLRARCNALVDDGQLRSSRTTGVGSRGVQQTYATVDDTDGDRADWTDYSLRGGESV